MSVGAGGLDLRWRGYGLLRGRLLSCSCGGGSTWADSPSASARARGGLFRQRHGGVGGFQSHGSGGGSLPALWPDTVRSAGTPQGWGVKFLKELRSKVGQSEEARLLVVMQARMLRWGKAKGHGTLSG